MTFKNYGFYGLVVLFGLVLGYRNSGQKIDQLYAKAGTKGRTYIGPWFTNLNLAKEDQRALQRAVVARIGLGANTAEEAIYLNAERDSDGNALRSDQAYEVIFSEPLPVKGFWSLTVYGADHYLVPNIYRRYAMASTDLPPAQSFPFSIRLQQRPPTDTNYWIPLPAGDEAVSLTLRCYHPTVNLLAEVAAVSFPEIKVQAK